MTANNPAIPPLNFTVAVTGHRDLAGADADKLGKAVAGALITCADTLGSRAAASDLDAARSRQLRFITALAEGADQLAGEAALSQPVHDAGWRCEAVLPFAAQHYRETFDDEAARKDFDDILEKFPDRLELADWHWTLPVEHNSDALKNSTPEYRTEAHWRERRYTTIGQLLVRRADMIIALWDGTPSGGQGGTADVVSQARRVGVPIIWIDPSRGVARSITPDPKTSHLPILEIVRYLTTPASRPSDSAYNCGGDGADLAIAAAIDNVLLGDKQGRADEVERYSDETKERVTGWRWKGKEFNGTAASLYSLFLWLVLLGTGTRTKPFRSGMRRTGWLRWLPQWIVMKIDYGDFRQPGSGDVDVPLEQPTLRADAIATRLGYLYRSTYVMIFLLATVAVMCALAFLFVSKESVSHVKPWFVLAELAVLALGMALFWAASPRRHNFHQRWLDARLIAESLRGEQLLSWIGFSGRRVVSEPEPKADAHGPPRTVWTPWLTNAFSALPGMPHGQMDPARIGEIASAVNKVVVGQRGYHKDNHRRLAKFHHRLDRIGIAAIIIGVMAAIFYLASVSAKYDVFPWLHPCISGLFDWTGPHYGWASPAAAFLGGVGPAVAAALASIRYHGDFERFAERSRNTQEALADLSVRAAALVTRADKMADKATNEKKADEASEARNNERPLFEELLALVLDTQSALDDDLADWRFAYAARPVPPPA